VNVDVKKCIIRGGEKVFPHFRKDHFAVDGEEQERDRGRGRRRRRGRHRLCLGINRIVIEHHRRGRFRQRLCVSSQRRRGHSRQCSASVCGAVCVCERCCRRCEWHRHFTYARIRCG
jgi:hypothetical protein